LELAGADPGQNFVRRAATGGSVEGLIRIATMLRELCSINPRLASFGYAYRELHFEPLNIKPGAPA
jgi:hypothetical protein